MTTIEDYFRDLAHEIRQEVEEREAEKKDKLSDEEIEGIIDTYVQAVIKHLIGGE